MKIKTLFFFIPLFFFTPIIFSYSIDQDSSDTKVLLITDSTGKQIKKFDVQDFDQKENSEFIKSAITVQIRKGREIYHLFIETTHVILRCHVESTQRISQSQVLLNFEIRLDTTNQEWRIPHREILTSSEKDFKCLDAFDHQKRQKLI